MVAILIPAFRAAAHPRGVDYNLHRVKGAEELVLVEGYWSVMRLQKLGVPAVALMGRDLLPEQEELVVASGVKRLVLLLDGDGPGREASAALLPRLARRFFVRVVELPEGNQPDTVAFTRARWAPATTWAFVTTTFGSTKKPLPRDSVPRPRTSW